MGNTPNAKRPERKIGKEIGILSTPSYKVNKKGGRVRYGIKFMQNFKHLKFVSGLGFIKSTLP